MAETVSEGMEQMNRRDYINQLVEQNIEDVSDAMDGLVFHIKELYSKLDESHVTIDQLLLACTPKRFIIHHQESGLDSITNDILAEIRDETGLTEIEKATRKLEEIINKSNTTERVKVGYRIEHSGRATIDSTNDNSTNAFVSDRNCDLLLHMNPIEGGALYRFAVKENLIKLKSMTLSDFMPHATLTATLIDPKNPLFPHVSSVYLFEQKELIKAHRLREKYFTSFGRGVGIEGGLSHSPTKRTLDPNQKEIYAFIADYHFHSGTTLGFLQDRLQEMAIQKGYLFHSERGRIATSANAEEEMVLHPIRHLYVDARTHIKRSVPGEILPENRRFAIQLLSNIMADLATLRGVGLEVYYIFPKEEIDTTKAAYVGKDMAILNDSEVLKKYFEQFDMRDPFTNPEISVIIGCKELFDVNSPHFMLQGIGKSIELTTEYWESKVREIKSFNYDIPGFRLFEPLRVRGSRKVGYRAITERSTEDVPAGTEKVIKIYDLTERSEKQIANQDIDRLARKDQLGNLLEIIKEASADVGPSNIARIEARKDDGFKLNIDGTKTPVTYLICEPYDRNLDQQFPLGHHMELSEIYTYSMPILKALSLVHKSSFAHLDVKFHNIGVKGEGNTLKVLMDDFEQCQHYGIPLATPNICSIDTRPREIHEIKEGDDKTYKNVDLTMDIFQMGAVLYRMTTGWNPFSPRMPKPIEGEGRQMYEDETKKNIMDNDHSVIFAQLNTIPTDISEIIIKAMQTDPKMRYQNASEMLDDVAKAKSYHDEYERINNEVVEGFYESLKGHTRRAERLLLELYPDASYAERIAILLHDNERTREDKSVWDKHSPYNEHKLRHATTGAEDAVNLHIKIDDQGFKDEIKYLILHHDDENINAVPATSDPEKDLRYSTSLQRIMDADALSFFSGDFETYKEKGFEPTKTKVRFTEGRMSTEAKRFLVSHNLFTKINTYLVN